MKCTAPLILSLLAALPSAIFGSGGIRGSTSRIHFSDESDILSGTAAGRLLSAKNYTDLQLCAQIASEAKNDHYFYLSMLDTNDNNQKGGCLLKVPKGKDGGDWSCCTVNNGASTKFNKGWSLVVADPKTMTDSGSKGYYACGAGCIENGEGTNCPNCSTYKYNDNQAGFRAFKAKDDSDDLTGHIDLWIHKSSKCGLTKEAGTDCKPPGTTVYKEYNHVHIGKGYCLEGGMGMSKACSECSAFGYKCKDSDC